VYDLNRGYKMFDLTALRDKGPNAWSQLADFALLQGFPNQGYCHFV
jgi:hypothetical protein